MKVIIYTLAFLVTLSGHALAQQDLKVPLSNPNRPGKLILNAIYADDIIINGYDGKEVLVILDGEDKDDERNLNRNGLRRISTDGVGLEVTEDNNEVTIRTSPSSNDLELEVKVPRDFSLMLQVTHGDIQVSGVNGEHEVRATNGDVEMSNIGGSVIVNSVNGDIEVTMNSVTPNTPMSFTGLNGDIEVAFPAGTRFTGKMKTDYGDVYTNFEISLNRDSNKAEVNSSDGKYTVTINKWISGDVNGGGPEFLFKTMHGDIEIRKN